MKKNLWLAACVCLLTFTACSDDDDDKSINVAKGQELSQTVYADEQEGTSKVEFTTEDTWTSSISGGVATKATETSTPDWISISPDHGEAGDHAIAISLKPNYTGEDRNAMITINCKGDKIEIKVAQKATTEDGEDPVEKYDLGFLALLDDSNLALLDEKGNIIEEIYSFDFGDDYPYLINYNEMTNDAYIQVDGQRGGSEVFSFNIKTKAKKAIAKDVDSYDFLFISVDEKYLVYDKQITQGAYFVKQTIASLEEAVLYQSSTGYAYISTVSKDCNTVVVEKDDDANNKNVIMLFEGDTKKYEFGLPYDSYVRALSPNNDKLLIIEEYTSKLTICDLSGENKEVIHQNDDGIQIESAVWSVDGNYIYFDNYNESGEVYKLDVKEKKLLLLTDEFPDEHLYRSGAISVKIQK